MRLTGLFVALVGILVVAAGLLGVGGVHGCADVGCTEGSATHVDVDLRSGTITYGPCARCSIRPNVAVVAAGALLVGGGVGRRLGS